MNKGGENREWGYASYDIDNPDKEGLTYTSYEKSGIVNQYHDNGDGGHSHYEWDDKKDHDLGKKSDYGREQSDNHENPTVEDVQKEDGSGCYLTTACLKHYQCNFNDKCEELETLRWFRDKYVSQDDILHYYNTAPQIVGILNSFTNNQKIYEYIYNRIINVCVIAIKNKKYAYAYKRYKNSMMVLESILINQNKKSIKINDLQSLILRMN